MATISVRNWKIGSYIITCMIRDKSFYMIISDSNKVMIGDEFIGHANSSLVRNSRLVLKSGADDSVIDLIPTLYDMTKIMMKIQCSLNKTSTDEKLLEEFSKMGSAIMKMTADVEYLRRKGH